MSFTSYIQSAAIESLSKLYGRQFSENDFQVNETKPEFTGDYTIVLFALVKTLRKSPEVLGNELGEQLLKDNPAFFSAFNVIKGFLNLSIADERLTQLLEENYQNQNSLLHFLYRYTQWQQGQFPAACKLAFRESFSAK